MRANFGMDLEPSLWEKIEFWFYEMWEGVKRILG